MKRNVSNSWQEALDIVLRLKKFALSSYNKRRFNICVLRSNRYLKYYILNNLEGSVGLNNLNKL